MKKVTTFASLLLIAIIGSLSTPALADQDKAKDRNTTQHAEKSSTKAKQDADEYQEKAAKRQQKSQKRDMKTARTESKAMRKNGNEDKGKHNGKANETALEMQARKDERQAIQEDYRANREPGQEGSKGEGKPAKKSWWKFWGDSDAAEQD